MIKLFFSCFVASCLAFCAVAQVAVVQGTVQNDAVGLFNLNIDLDYLGKGVQKLSTVIKDGAFKMEVYVPHSQVVEWRYGPYKNYFLLNPNDNIQLSFDGVAPHKMQIAGAPSIQNNVLKKYRESFNNEFMDNEFGMHYLRKNIYLYRVPGLIDTVMLRLAEPGFLNYQSQIFTPRHKFLEDNKADFLRVDLEFKQYLTLLAYGHLYRFRHQIEPTTYFKFLDKININQPEMLGSEAYRQFLMAYLNYYQENNQPLVMATHLGTSAYAQQYKMVPEIITDETIQLWLKAQLIKKAFEFLPSKEAKLLHDDYLKNNPNSLFEDVLDNALQSSLRFQVGEKAPKFTLRNVDDQSSYTFIEKGHRGKVYCLYFWATWCAPCVKKITELQAIINKQPNIKFIFIALESDIDKLKKYIDEKQWKGLHLITESQALNGGVTKWYEVTSLPKMVAINKHFRVDSTPTTLSIDSLEAMLEALARKKY